MSDLMAVYSTGASTIHLYLEGYRPGRKPRNYETALCGSPAGLVWGRDQNPTGRKHIPFNLALRLEAEVALADDPRPYPAHRRWCPLCVGRAVAHYDFLPHTLDEIADAAYGQER